jgi:hypothetical protein
MAEQDDFVAEQDEIVAEPDEMVEVGDAAEVTRGKGGRGSDDKRYTYN